jgi:hypothetical protein
MQKHNLLGWQSQCHSAAALVGLVWLIRRSKVEGRVGVVSVLTRALPDSTMEG